MPRKKKESKAEISAQAEEIVELGDALRLLHTSRSTLYRWIREGRIRAAKAGRQWRFHRSDIERFLGGATPRADLPVGVEPFFNALSEAARSVGLDPEKSLSKSPDDLMERSIDLILSIAARRGASDIHVAPHWEEGKVRVPIRLRCDGVLQTIADLDARLLSHHIERWKARAGCDILDTVHPQDGQILNLAPDGVPFNMRLSFLPTGLGPSLTARILHQMNKPFELDAMPYSPADMQRIKQAIHLPNGLIAFSGPTGSGKSTTLYAALGDIASSREKVFTVENPIEMRMPWVVQVQVDHANGLSFPRVLRSFMRGDPDVILCGEIRDAETLQLGIQIALTGHLFLMTLHAEDAVSAIRRMLDIGAAPFLLADTCRLIISQRLVRMLCPHCSRPTAPVGEVWEWARAVLKENALRESDFSGDYREAVGCGKCGHAGYRGRTLMAETLMITPALGDAIRRNADVMELRRVAIAEGMTTFAADGIRRAAKGETTLEEVRRGGWLGIV